MNDLDIPNLRRLGKESFLSLQEIKKVKIVKVLIKAWCLVVIVSFVCNTAVIAAENESEEVSRNKDILETENSKSGTDSWYGTAEDLWRKTTEAAPSAWGSIKDSSLEVWSATKEKTSDTWNSSQKYFEANPNADNARIWQNTTPKLAEALVLQEKHENLPKESWIGDNQKKNQEAINELLDEVVQILSVTQIPKYRERVADLQEKIKKAREKIVDYREERSIAPTDSLVHKTIKDYDELIKNKEAEIVDFEKQLTEIRQDFAKELRAIGLDLDQATLDLLSKNIHVSGDLYIDLSITFHQVKILLGKLEQLVNESKEDLQYAKRYYGLYVILLKSLYYAQEEVDRKLQEEYIAGIDAIIAELTKIVEETKIKIQQFPDRAAPFTTLIDQQKFSIKVANEYRAELTNYRGEINKARTELNKDIALAWQTYKTVRAVSELSNIINESQTLLDNLGNLQVPRFRPFENLKIEQEYENITQKLRMREN